MKKERVIQYNLMFENIPYDIITELKSIQTRAEHPHTSYIESDAFPKTMA